MRQSRVDRLAMQARVVGLTLQYAERPRKATYTKTSEERRPKTEFRFWPRNSTEGPPIFVAMNSKLAIAFITGFAQARLVAIRAERVKKPMREAFDSVALDSPV